MGKLHYWECPSYVCKKCGYTFQENGVCPECNQPLTKCDYKTDDIEKQNVCPKCNNGIKWQTRNREIYKRKIDSEMENKFKEIQRIWDDFNKSKSLEPPKYSEDNFFTNLNDDGFPSRTSFTKSEDVCSKDATPSAIERLRNWKNMKKF